jgi:hypothetical protein
MCWLLTVTLRSVAPAAPCTYWRACANNSHAFGRVYHIHGVPATHRCKLTNRRGGRATDAGLSGLKYCSEMLKRFSISCSGLEESNLQQDSTNDLNLTNPPHWLQCMGEVSPRASLEVVSDYTRYFFGVEGRHT